MQIRRAHESDAPALARVHVDSWQVAYRGLVPDSHLQRFTYKRREDAFRKSLATGAEETYLIEDQGAALGILTVGACRDADIDTALVGEIWGIYVSPAHWRAGIGKRLLDEGESILGSRGYALAVLWVLAGNAQARAFYEATGYRTDGAAKTVHLSARLEAVRYLKSLVPGGP